MLDSNGRGCVERENAPASDNVPLKLLARARCIDVQSQEGGARSPCLSSIVFHTFIFPRIGVGMDKKNQPMEISPNAAAAVELRGTPMG